MVKNELYEQAIEKIVPKLEKLKGRPFDEIIEGLIHEMIESGICQDLMFALTYVLDPSKFYIEVGYWTRYGEYTVNFAVDTPQYCWGPDIGVNIKADESERPTDEEARDLIKKYIGRRDKGGIDVEGLIKRAEEVVDTCRIVRRKNGRRLKDKSKA